MHLRTILVPVLSLTVMVLSGCTNGPSESDIEKAVKAQANDPNISPMDKDLLATIKVKKLGCKEDVSGYICDIETDNEKVGHDGKKAHIFSARMIKGSAGWTIQPLPNR